MHALSIEETLIKAAAAVDDGWSVLALFIVCTAVLVWKFGGPLLELVEVSKSNHAMTTETLDKANEIGDSIKTNHGSKNIGDAIDRLTEQMWAIDQKLDDHIASNSK